VKYSMTRKAKSPNSQWGNLCKSLMLHGVKKSVFVVEKNVYKVCEIGCGASDVAKYPGTFSHLCSTRNNKMLEVTLVDASLDRTRAIRGESYSNDTHANLRMAVVLREMDMKEFWINLNPAIKYDMCTAFFSLNQIPDEIDAIFILMSMLNRSNVVCVTYPKTVPDTVHKVFGDFTIKASRVGNSIKWEYTHEPTGEVTRYTDYCHPRMRGVIDRFMTEVPMDQVSQDRYFATIGPDQTRTIKSKYYVPNDVNEFMRGFWGFYFRVL